MEWRVYLDGEESDLARLSSELRTGDLIVNTEAATGTYLQSETFESLADANEVRMLAEPIIYLLNGISALLAPGGRWVTFAGRVSRASPTGPDDTVSISSTIFVTGTGRLTLTGTVGGGPDAAPTSSETTDRLLAIANRPILAEVYRILGSVPTPKWSEFYKVYELIREASGGSDRGLSLRSGVSQAQIEKLTMSANHPKLSGPDARHAVMRGEPSASRKLTLYEGRAVIDQLIQGFSR